MRRFLFALAVVVAFACGWLVRAKQSSPTRERTDTNLRAVRISQPDPTSPGGRKSTLLAIYRVTGGPEGTIEYAPVPTRTSPDGVEDIHPGPEMWVCSIGQRSYVFGPRD